MVPRLLLIAVLAALALAMPAAAEDGPADEADSASDPPQEQAAQEPAPPESNEPASSDPSSGDDAAAGEAPACAPIDPSCLASEPLVWTTQPSYACQPYELQDPGDGPVTETASIDPDGCYRDFLRRALGWPPVTFTSPITSSLIELLPWP